MAPVNHNVLCCLHCRHAVVRRRRDWLHFGFLNGLRRRIAHCTLVGAEDCLLGLGLLWLVSTHRFVAVTSIRLQAQLFRRLPRRLHLRSWFWQILFCFLFAFTFRVRPGVEETIFCTVCFWGQRPEAGVVFSTFCAFWQYTCLTPLPTARWCYRRHVAQLCEWRLATLTGGVGRGMIRFFFDCKMTLPKTRCPTFALNLGQMLRNCKKKIAILTSCNPLWIKGMGLRNHFVVKKRFA